MDITTVGPAVTVTTGAKALVFTSCRLSSSTTGITNYASPAVTGATTTGASDNNSIINEGASTNAIRAGVATLYTSLTPGSNTWTLKYRVTSGTGTYQNRRVVVMGL